MENFIQVISNFLSNIIQLDIFLYFLAALAVFGVILLIKKIIYT